MSFLFSDIATWSGGAIVRGDESYEVSHVVTDSRTAGAHGGMFVALVGPNFDGHDFLEDARLRGAAAAMVVRGHESAASGYAHVLAVDDTLAALQAVAAAWRARFEGTVVGITGSNGKTIVKEMLAAILGSVKTVYRSPGSYNSQVGVPLSVLGIGTEHEVAIIEAGISKRGEMQRLEPIVRPDVGIITNIGMAHAAGFGSLEVTAREKLTLFSSLERPSQAGVLIYCADDPVLRSMESSLPDYHLAFGESVDADYRLSAIVAQRVGFRFRLRFPEGAEHEFELTTPGRHNVWNAAAAIACADVLGVPAGRAAEALREFAVADMRMEMHTTESGVTLLNDAYSSDPVSAAAALNALVHYAAGQRTIAIVGDMLDLGRASEQAHRDIGGLVHTLGIDHLVCVGPQARMAGREAVERGMPLSHVWEVPSTDGLEELLDHLVAPGDWVLFKGSRAVGLERAATSLLESMAPARLYVDLDAIRENVQAIRRRIGAKTGVMAVVKSYGYGNDANRVALTLVQAGVDAFAVAYPDEGIPLRRHGIEVPILVTNVRPGEVDKIAKYRLMPLVFDLEVVEALETEAAHREQTIDVHVEVDTGMNRLGIEPQDAVAFCREVANRPHLRLDGVMTHFAAADDPTEDDFTLAQIAAFDAVVKELTAAGLRPRVVHAANTAAAWRFPQAKYDMVRVGLGLYGVHPSPDVEARARDVRPSLQFATQIIFVKDVEPGETVGYGRTWKAPERRRIATVAIGYNDGFPRFMSNGGEVLVRGVRCPVVGNVCMDVSMVDVTDAPGASAGDEVVIFGSQGEQTITVEEVAARGGTINYEILTNVSPRVRRVFRR